jgi:hypothetical protein
VARPCRILTELPGPPRTFALYRQVAQLSAMGTFCITDIKRPTDLGAIGGAVALRISCLDSASAAASAKSEQVMRSGVGISGCSAR